MVGQATHRSGEVYTRQRRRGRDGGLLTNRTTGTLLEIDFSEALGDGARSDGARHS